MQSSPFQRAWEGALLLSAFSGRLGFSHHGLPLIMSFAAVPLRTHEVSEEVAEAWGVSNFWVLNPCARGELCAQPHPMSGPNPSNLSSPRPGLVPRPCPPTLTQGNILLQRADVKTTGALSYWGDRGTQTQQSPVQAWFLPGASPGAQCGQDPSAFTVGGSWAVIMVGACRKSHPGPLEYKFSL